ncbi:MAG: DUF885 family protein [Chitinophagaceae bacterium]|nr:DUF885 family protein [Chitinophagaceae bacterium]
MKKLYYLRTFYLFVSFLILSSSATKSQDVSEPLMPFLINEYQNDVSDLSKVYIFHYSDEYFNRFEKFHKDWIEKLKKVDFKKMDVSSQADYILLKRNIESDRYELAADKKNFDQVRYAIPFADSIMAMQRKRRRGTTPDAMQWAASLSKVIEEIQQAKETITRKPLANNDSKKVVITIIKQLRDGLKNVYDFYDGYNPQFTWWMHKTFPQTDSSLSSFSKWLAARPVQQQDVAMDNSGIIGHPIGREEILRQLKYEMIDYTPEDLIALAESQYQWCLKQMIQVSKQMGFGDNWKAALEEVKHHYLPVGEQPALINQLQEQAISFIDSLGLVTIPPIAKEAWRMDMLSVKMMEFASYFLGGSEILVAYPHEDQDFDTKRMIMRSGNFGFAHAEVFHELIPGHNLQFFMFRRYKPYRRPFNTAFSTEGWPFYWEMTLWDKGFDNTTDEKAGALFWRMTRCARIVFSLNYHLGKWTPQQCIDYLVDKAGLERFSAESEVRRSFTGGYGPLYQLAYMTGALQLYALHHEMVTSGKMTDREFNDAYLHNGNIPIEIFRDILMNKKLLENYSPNWKFIDEVNALFK